MKDRKEIIERILGVLRASPATSAYIATRTGIPVETVIQVLVELEVDEGMVASTGGRYWIVPEHVR
ncbi:MAG: hypothetical protein AAB518_02485 [Patescibacteria group bacterium]